MAPRPRAYSLELQSRPDHLQFRVEGVDHSFATLRACWTELIAEARRRRATRLLVFDALPGNPVLHELVEIANTVMGPALKGIRLALVHADDSDRRYAEFMEVLLRRQGVVAHSFGCVASAEEWLRAIGYTRDDSHSAAA